MAIDPRFFEQARSFINETMKSVIPDANVDGGSGINAVLGRGGATISASLLQEIEHMITTRDLTDPDALTEQDMDLLLENLLTSRDGGDLAFGFVRAFYPDRITREFGSGLAATIESKEVTFITISDFVFDPQDYFLDQDTGDYFINIPFVGEKAGEEYNVEVGEINQLINDNSAAARVTNTTKFRNGKPKQTNTQALRKAQRGISTRTPLSKDGAVFFMQDLFGSKLADLLVIGNGDVEMTRDEVHDFGVGAVPQFKIGVDSINPDTRVQEGAAQTLFVGGRTDLYSLFDTINYVQKHVDLFADMTLDADITGPVGSLAATFVVGTTGTVPSSGKLMIDLGNAGEETVAYSSRTTVDNNTFTFVLSAPGTTQIHVATASIKAVNNTEITIAPDGDITILPVFQVADIRLLDPITFEPVGQPLVETTAESKTPGWYIDKSNRYDLLSARETKSLFIDEKRDAVLYPGNQAQNGTAGTTSSVTIGGVAYTKYAEAGADFTGYQGREIALSGGIATVTRSIIQIVSTTEVALSGPLLAASAGDVDFVIASSYQDFNEFPVRVSYYTNTELGEAQQFLDQDARRILAGDVLSRSFMPVFLDFTLSYKGDGTADSVRESINDVFKTSSGEAIGESTGAKFEYSDLINAPYIDGKANFVQTPFQVRIRRLQTDGTFKTDYINPDQDTVNDLAVKTAAAVLAYTGDGGYTDATTLFTTAGAYTFLVGDVGKKIFITGVGLVTITGFVSSTTVNVSVTFTSTTGSVDWSFPVYFLETRRPTSVEAFTIPPEGKLILGAFTSNVETAEYDSVISESDTEFTFILKEGESINLPHSVDEPMRVSRLDYEDANVITDGVITDQRSYRPFFGSVVVEKLES